MAASLSFYRLVPDETLVRWEENRREQFGSAIALVFGLSTGALAYCGSLLADENVTLGGARTYWFVAAVMGFVFTMVLSVVVTLTRLADARVTAKIVRYRVSGDSTKQAEIESLRKRGQWLSAWSWSIFVVQILSFMTSAGLILVALWLIFQNKLFP